MSTQEYEARGRRDPEQPLADAAPLHRPTLGAEGEPCASCGAPLASDQRYCLRCGTRRAGARVPFLDILSPAREREVETVRTDEAPVASSLLRGGGIPAALVAGLGVALLALGLVVGSLLAEEPAPVVSVPAAKPPVVNNSISVPAGGGAATAAETAGAAFSSDWPGPPARWAVQLETLPKDGTTPDAVAAAKAKAASDGASDVGALDTDDFETLDPGLYVVYSGAFKSRREAREALGDLRGDFRGAKVVEVSTEVKADASADTQSDAELEAQQNRSPEEAQKEIRKAPDKLQSEGPAPKKDDKPAGGGSDATEIE